MFNFLIKSPISEDQRRIDQLRSVMGQIKRERINEEFSLWMNDASRTFKILSFYLDQDIESIDEEAWDTIFNIFKKNYHYWIEEIERAS